MAGEKAEEKMGIFQGIRYFLETKNVKNAIEVKEKLKKGGAEREFYISDLVTHHISDVPPDQIVSDCINLHLEWVVMSEKCGAQLPTPPFEHKVDMLFSGLVFCTSKLSRSDMEKLHVLVMYYGGKAQRTLNPSVTHLITMETSGPKFERAQKHSDTIKVVTPDWLLDCIEGGKRVGEEDYHPSRLKGKSVCNGETTTTDNGKQNNDAVEQSEVKSELVCSIHHEKLGKESKESESSSKHDVVATTSVTSEAPQTAESNDDQPVMSPKVVLEPKRDGALPKPTISDESPMEATAAQQQASGDVVSVPPGTLLEGIVIHFTDYQDCMDNETIDKWKQVVVQHGGRIVDDPNQCTHLLALHKKSDVFVKAFGDGKCVASAHWLNEVLTEQKMFPPRNPLHFPTAFKWQLPDAQKYSMSLTNYTESERELVKDMFRIAGIPFTGHLSKENTHLICKSPEGKKYEKAVEWGVPVVNGTFLAEMIHNGQVPAVLYPRHTKLGQPDEFSPGSCFEAIRLLKPWEPFIASYSQLHPNLVDKASAESVFQLLTSASSSQSSSQASSLGKRTREESGATEEGEDLAKKLKLESGVVSKDEARHGPPPTVLFTGISQSLVKKLRKVVTKLGGNVTDSGRECTHIVSTRVTRTVKFLSGISVCQHIVTPEWVEASGREDRFVKEDGFVLTDSDAEQMFQMNVASSLARARQKKLLEGLYFFATPSVQPPFANFKEIVECAGGTFLSEADLQVIYIPDNSKFIVISSPEDVASNYCLQFFRNKIGVYNAEFVLTGVLRQELDYTHLEIDCIPDLNT